MALAFSYFDRLHLNGGCLPEITLWCSCLYKTFIVVRLDQDLFFCIPWHLDVLARRNCVPLVLADGPLFRLRAELACLFQWGEWMSRCLEPAYFPWKERIEYVEIQHAQTFFLLMAEVGGLVGPLRTHWIICQSHWSWLDRLFVQLILFGVKVYKGNLICFFVFRLTAAMINNIKRNKKNV